MFSCLAQIFQIFFYCMSAIGSELNEDINLQLHDISRPWIQICDVTTHLNFDLMVKTYGTYRHQLSQVQVDVLVDVFLVDVLVEVLVQHLQGKLLYIIQCAPAAYQQISISTVHPKTRWK